MGIRRNVADLSGGEDDRILHDLGRDRADKVARDLLRRRQRVGFLGDAFAVTDLEVLESFQSFNGLLVGLLPLVAEGKGARVVVIAGLEVVVARRA